MASITMDLGLDGEITYFDVDDETIHEIEKILHDHDYSLKV